MLWSKKRFQEPISHGTGTLDADDLSNRYLWGPVVDQLLADEQIDWTNNEANGEVLWALTDHLGTVRDPAKLLRGAMSRASRHMLFLIPGRKIGQRGRPT